VDGRDASSGFDIDEDTLSIGVEIMSLAALDLLR
jgi:hypothetical protein